MNFGIQIRISDVIFALQKRWKMIISVAMIGVVLGLVLSAMTVVQSTQKVYSISGSFAVSTKAKDGFYLSGTTHPGTGDYNIAIEMVSPILYLMKTKRVLNEVLNREGVLGITTSDLNDALSVSQRSSIQVIDMSITWPDPEEAISLWNRVFEVSNEAIPQVYNFGTLVLINEPSARQIGSGTSSTKMPVILAVLGSMVGVGYAVMEMLVHPTFNNLRDIEQVLGLENIATIPQDTEYFRNRGSMLVENEEGGGNEIIQNFSSAAYILRNRLGAKDKHQCFYVTSSISGEGRTTVAAYLGIQLSDMEEKTLLIDFDTRSPSLATQFLEKVDYNHSLNALYRGEVNEVDAITPLTGYLDILPLVLEHNTVTMDGAVVELIQKLMEKYSYVIIDAPPVGVVSETLRLNQVASTVLFVIGYDKASMPEIQRSLDKLDKSGIRVLGCIVNGMQTAKNWLSVAKEDKDKVKAQKKKKQKKKQKERKAKDKEKEDAPPSQAHEVDGINDELIRKGTDGTKKPVKKTGLFGRKKPDAASAKKKTAKPAPVRADPLPDDGEKPADKANTEAAQAPDVITAPKPAVFSAKRNIMDDLVGGGSVDDDKPDGDILDEMIGGRKP